MDLRSGKEGLTINDDLHPAGPLGEPVFAQVGGNEGSLHQELQIMVDVLKRLLPEFVGQMRRQIEDSFEGNTVLGHAGEVRPAQGSLEIFEVAVVEQDVFGYRLRVSITQYSRWREQTYHR